MTSVDFQQSDNFENGVVFEGNVQRDTVIYRALALGELLLSHCFQNEKLRSDFEKALNDAGPGPEGQPETIDEAIVPMASLSFGDDGGGLVLGKNRRGEDYLMIISSDVFQSVVALLYDSEQLSLESGAMVNFDGKPAEAAELMSALIEGIGSGRIRIDEGSASA